MEFTKLHGLGNDFVLINALDRQPPEEARPDLARRSCDRHFGIGADGLILALPSERADFRMQIFNADGSEANHCGNGIRCLARFLYEQGRVTRHDLTIETIGRVNRLELLPEASPFSVRVDMGEPEFQRAAIPMELNGSRGEEALEEPLDLGQGTVLRISCVSMGNPHAVTFVEDVEKVPLRELGPLVEHHPAFPSRINTEFIQVLGPERLRMRVWERGAGETLACGTGACASVAVAARLGRTGRSATVELAGGNLQIEWRNDNHIYMTGPAVRVFDGTWAAAASGGSG
jgi:diaminopimelate epimerase